MRGHRRPRGGQGVQLRLRRARRTAARRRRRRRRVRPADRTVAAGTAALVLPGGFPEEFSTELSANDRVRRQIAALAAAGAPVHAECAGLTYLVRRARRLPDVRCARGYGTVHRQADTGLPRRRRGSRLVAVRAGERVVGHEFHRTTVTFADGYQPAWVYRGHDLAAIRDGAVHGGVHASYLHTHPAGRPHATTRFVAAAATSRDSPGDSENAYLVGLRLAGKKVVVVGGGTVAQRRIPLLIATGADVHVISRSATPAVEAMSGITLALSDYRGRRPRRSLVRDRGHRRSGRQRRRRRRGRTPANLLRPRRHRREGTAVTPASFDYEGLVGRRAGRR